MPPHSSNSPQDGQDRPKFYFKGVYLPANVIDMMVDGDISRTEIVLLAIIHALSEKTSCFASNAYLGSIIKIQPNRVSDAIQRLRKRGLVVVSMSDERRGLDVRWDGVTPTPCGGRGGTPARGRGATPARGSIIDTKIKDTKINSPLAKKRPTRFAREGVPATGEGVFVPSLEPQTTSLIKGWVVRLHKTVASRLNAHVVAGTAWHKAFRLLQSKLKQDNARIETVLAWLEESHASLKFPIESAAGFEKRFHSLEAMMGNKTNVAPAAKPLSPLAESILARVNALQWPSAAQAALPNAVAVSLANHEKFHKRASALYAAKSKEEKSRPRGSRVNSQDRAVYNFLQDQQWTILLAPEEFVYQWFFNINKSVAGWDDWSGNLDKRVFAEETPQFDKWGAGVAAKYGDIKLWDRFKKEIG